MTNLTKLSAGYDEANSISVYNKNKNKNKNKNI
jgi:hypothetical protein